MSIEEILSNKKKYNKPPNLNSISDVLNSVEEYLSHIYKNGGEINIPINLKYNPEDSLKSMLRFSSSGKCPRAISYSMLFPEKKEPLSPRAISIFQLGHIVHDVERLIISEVNELVDQEKEVYIEVDGFKIFGHIDGILKLKNKDVLLDIKTVNERAWKEFDREIPKDYIAQLNVYMYATGLREAYLWVYNKGTSHRKIVPVVYNQSVVDESIKRFKSAIHGFKTGELPERPYVYNEVETEFYIERTLPWQCSYCAFTKLCWPNFNKTVDNNGKIKYIQTILKEKEYYEENEDWVF
jgi:CRISPR/Cas system-associated exonuclease Cas4 (RecB family)